MSRRKFALGMVPLVLLAACGSSKTPATVSSATVPSAPARTATAPQPGATTAPLPGVTATTAPATSTTTAQPGPAGGSTGTTAPAGGSTRVRLPATFRVRPGGALDPRSVSSPAFLAVDLTVISADGKPHRVLVRTPRPQSLSIPARGRATVQLPGLRAGQYPILVDGVVGGTLNIGAEPGP